MTNNQVKAITLAQWREQFSAAQRARIGAAYLLDLKRARVRDAMSNHPTVADQALKELEMKLTGFITGECWPQLWTVDYCLLVLRSDPWKLVGGLAMAYATMTGARRDAILERGKALLAQHLPDVDPLALIMGRV